MQLGSARQLCWSWLGLLTCLGVSFLLADLGWPWLCPVCLSSRSRLDGACSHGDGTAARDQVEIHKASWGLGLELTHVTYPKQVPGWAQNWGGGHYMTKGLNKARLKSQHHDYNPCSQKKNNAGDFCHGLLSPVLRRHKLQFSLLEDKTYSLMSGQWSGNYHGTELKFTILYGLESALQSRREEFPWTIWKSSLSCFHAACECFPLYQCRLHHQPLAVHSANTSHILAFGSLV